MKVEHIEAHDLIFWPVILHLMLDDGHNYTKTKDRYYRTGLIRLRQAVQAWVRERVHAPTPYFVLQLGDLIDGHAATSALGSEETLKRALKEFEPLQDCVVHHCVGNHELYNNACRDYWKRYYRSTREHEPPGASSTPPQAPSTPRRALYYAFTPHPKFCFVKLDTYDVSILGSEPESTERADAERYLQKNPNKDRNSPLGLKGLDRRFVLYNGGVGSAQLSWLRKTLQAAGIRGCEHVVIFSHIPLHPDACSPECLLWNYAEILQILAETPGLVKVCLSGHAHEARVIRDGSSGIVHYVLDTPLEQRPPKQNAYSMARVYTDQIVIRGQGANRDVQCQLTTMNDIRCDPTQKT